MALDYSFTGIRLLNGGLYPVDWHIAVNLIAELKNSKVKEEAEQAANVAYQRLYYWLDVNLQDIIMVDVSSEDDLYLASLASNIAMYCPGLPNDDLIIQLLHSKFTTIVGTNLVIGEIHLKGSDTTLSYTFDAAEGEYELPLLTSDYYSAGITRDETPWWARNDGFCFELARNAEEDDKKGNIEYFSNFIDPLIEFDRAAASSSSHISISKEPAKIVQIEKWKPRTI